MVEPEIVLRPGTAGDWDAVADLMGYVFHENYTAELRASEGSVQEFDRSIVAEDGKLIAGHTTAFSREVTVPGGIVPAAHVTGVGVLPTHRRRGLLTRMMARQLGDVAAAGREPIATLYASETKIYPRFGYGMAAPVLHTDAMTREIVPPALPEGYEGRLRLVKPSEAITELAAMYERVRPLRVGWSSRDERWWAHLLEDLESERHGATELHGVVHDTPTGPSGYALWRVKDGWEPHGPNGTTSVTEVVTDDLDAYRALWRFLLTIDLTRKARLSFLAPDEPLLHLVDEPRRLGTRLADGLWVRLVDLPAALSARRYVCPIDLVFEVTDRMLPGNEGRWRLTAGPDAAVCTRTEDPADLSCSVLELGVAYLGGVSLAALAAAGRVRESTPGAINAASTAFGWHRLPNPIEAF
jgi:predicted acetyltransferase